MSFILDALKKSELERQRQSLPGLMDPGAAVPRSRFPLWAAALGILLAVNLLVLSFVLLRRVPAAGTTEIAPAATRVTTAATPGTPGAGTPGAGTPGDVAAGAGPMPAASAGGTAAVAAAAVAAAAVGPAPVPNVTAVPVTAADSAGEHFSPMDGAPATYAPEIPLAEGNAAKTQVPARRSDPYLRPAQATKSAAARADEASDEVLPSVDQVNLPAAQALPDLHLDVHVYATGASDRFVYINGHKYREGMRLAEGPTVERIRRDGVVLNAEGIRFLLPRE